MGGFFVLIFYPPPPFFLIECVGCDDSRVEIITLVKEVVDELDRKITVRGVGCWSDQLSRGGSSAVQPKPGPLFLTFL